MKQIFFTLPYRYPDIKIHADAAGIDHDLGVYYNCDFKCTPSDEALCITVKNDSNGKIISFGECTYSVYDPLPVIDDIIQENCWFEERLFGLHAACVAFHNKAYIFIAPTSSGKSTLTTYLVNMGFEYITDDCTLIDKKTLTVQPYGNPIRLRDGGLNVLKTNEIDLITEPSGDRHIYKPKALVLKPLKICNIYFVRRDSMINALSDITQSKCVELLMRSPIKNYDLSFSHIKFLYSLAQLKVQKLIYKDMKFVLEIVRSEALL